MTAFQEPVSKSLPGPPGGMVDAADLKSAARKGVGVRVPRWASFYRSTLSKYLCFADLMQHEKTLAVLVAAFDVHADTIGNWRHQLLEGSALFPSH